jgi:serine/threonine protein kinase
VEGVQSIVHDRYRVDAVIGYGGMATVYRADDRRLERTVAIKVLADNLASNPAFRERFEREARMAASLTHLNIVQIYDVAESDDGRPFIVMEYVEGRSLADLMVAEGALAPSRVAALAADVGAGLAHAHGRGLVHRDVKPGNLLLANDGTAKIADFGIARSAGSPDLTQTGAIIGTAGYLAPEQRAGADATPASDVYSLGLVLARAATGTSTSGAIPSPDAIAAACGEPLGALIVACMAHDPTARPPAATVARQAASLTGAEGDPTRTLGIIGATAAMAPTSQIPIVAAPAALGHSLGRPLGVEGAALIVGIMAAIALVAYGLLSGGGHSTNRLTSTSPSTVVAPTTLPPTTSPPATAPLASACGPVSVSANGLYLVAPNSSCAQSQSGASGDTANGENGANGPNNGPNSGVAYQGTVAPPVYPRGKGRGGGD